MRVDQKIPGPRSRPTDEWYRQDEWAAAAVAAEDAAETGRWIRYIALGLFVLALLFLLLFR